jgi:Flp pilus assembly protein TadB
MAIVFWIILKQAINSRRATFEKQLVDSLDLGARSLRAGHPLTGAFQLMADEIEAPLGNTHSI